MDEIVNLLSKAKEDLEKAKSKLNRASTFSIIDVIFRGSIGLIADVFEYSRFSEAKTYIKEATQILKEVREKMKRVEISVPEIDHTALWATLDIGLDGLVIDLIRHYEISQARKKVEEVIENIDRLIDRLKT